VRRIAVIVEGHGEVQAVPVLLRRVLALRDPATAWEVKPPIRVHRDKFINDTYEFRRHLLLAAGKAGGNGAVLVILDADDDCPKRLGPELRERAVRIASHIAIHVVLANREYEAWFLACADALAGHRGLPSDLAPPEDPEGIRGAKEWLSKRMGGYDPRLDQAPLTSRIDIAAAQRRSRSFRKLIKDLDSLFPTTSDHG
jgi:hypothetical protein